MHPPTVRIVQPDRHRRVAATWVAILVLVGGIGLAGRMLPQPNAPGGEEPGRSSSGAVRTTPPAAGDAAKLFSPRPGVLWFRSGVVPVSGAAPHGVARVRAVLSAGGRIIGQRELAVGADGRFAGPLSIAPPQGRTEALLTVVAPGDGRELGHLPLSVQGGSPILIWTPADPDEPVSGDVLHVTGPVVGRVARVVVRLTDEHGVTIVEDGATIRREAGSGAGPRSNVYEAELPLPDQRPRRPWLLVLALDGVTGEVIGRDHTRVTVAPSSR
jgi:hypothetical protein